MPALFPDNIIKEIQDKCNIAEVISQYIPLKQAGRNFKALCPFHQEKTPSFMVSPDKGIYHCFGCGAGGDVFSFVMKYEGLEFPQAVRMLAERTNVQLPERSAFSAQRQEDTRDLFAVNETAAVWFESNLRKETGRSAVEYLKKRQQDAPAVVKFRLGFAPANNGLLFFLRNKGIAPALLEKAGLVLCGESNAYYDRFRQRIIFPIFDSRSRILAFGGRVLDDSLPKYMNSPETAIYSKGRHLYGLNFACEEIMKQDLCIIVEGYIDVITAHQYGITNTVAPLGTALTLEQIRLLKRWTHNVVVIFDADRAGEMAALRSLDLFIEEELSVRLVSLPQGDDPDSFIRKSGADTFREKVRTSCDIFDYKLNALTKTYDLNTVDGKVNIAARMLPTVRRVPNAIRRSMYVKRLAEEFSKGEKALGEEWILAELKKVKTEAPLAAKEVSAALQSKGRYPEEEMIVKILLEDESAFEEINKQLTVDEFQDMRIREIMRAVLRLFTQREKVCPSMLIGCIGDEETARLISRICSSTGAFVDRAKTLRDCIARVKKNGLKNKLRNLQQEIRRAQGWEHKEKVSELVNEYNALIKTRTKAGAVK